MQEGIHVYTVNGKLEKILESIASEESMYYSAKGIYKNIFFEKRVEGKRKYDRLFYLPKDACLIVSNGFGENKANADQYLEDFLNTLGNAEDFDYSYKGYFCGAVY